MFIVVIIKMPNANTDPNFIHAAVIPSFHLNSSYPVVTFELIVCPITRELLGARLKERAIRVIVCARVCVIAEGGAKDFFRTITSSNRRGVVMLLHKKLLMSA